MGTSFFRKRTDCGCSDVSVYLRRSRSFDTDQGEEEKWLSWENFVWVLFQGKVGRGWDFWLLRRGAGDIQMELVCTGFGEQGWISLS